VTPGEFQALYPHVIGWIRLTLAAHEKNAKSVASVGFASTTARIWLVFIHPDECIGHRCLVIVM